MTPSALSPGEHGGDAARVARALGIPLSAMVDLSVSLNPVAPPAEPVVAKHMSAIGRYPDASRATRALARTMGVDPDHLVLTNGGAEAIAAVAAHLGRGYAEDPDFSLYRRHIPQWDACGPLFASNPNNPTGALAGPDESAAVWDEAFYAMATGEWTRGDVGNGAFVVGSLTKLFACPGLRIGYVLAPDAGSARAIAGRLPQWSVNGLVCEALRDLLGELDLASVCREIVRLRTKMCGILEGHGLAPLDSHANYVVAKAPRGLWDALARRAVLVRDCASFGMEGWVRIAVPDDAGIGQLDAALDGALGECGEGAS